MKDDPQAPSRSYLKVEEAFAIFGKAPQSGQRVADLGAAPGGWSWAAARRGAEVWAIDNGPLKKAAATHALIHHVRADAFVWTPPAGGVDWLLCDMVEQPIKVMRRVRSWFENRWCRCAVINFKYGHADALKVLGMVGSSAGMGDVSRRLVCRHLFHDREEITVMVEV
jgi:23S rRNA (cytidine2498-2'-O)-methyltransferase